MPFDPGNVLTVSGGNLTVDLAAINTYLTGTTLDITTTTTKKGAAIKALMDYLVASALSDTYDSDATYPVTASNGEFDDTPTYGMRGTTAYQYKSYSLKTWSGATAPSQNFDPDLMDY